MPTSCQRLRILAVRSIKGHQENRGLGAVLWGVVVIKLIFWGLFFRVLWVCFPVFHVVFVFVHCFAIDFLACFLAIDIARLFI
jgi:hypothetical protein